MGVDLLRELILSINGTFPGGTVDSYGYSNTNYSNSGGYDDYSNTGYMDPSGYSSAPVQGKF